MKLVVSTLTNLLRALTNLLGANATIINRVKYMAAMSTEEILQELDKLFIDIYEAGACIHTLASTDEERAVASRYYAATDAVGKSIQTISTLTTLLETLASVKTKCRNNTAIINRVEYIEHNVSSTEELIQELDKLAMDIYEAGADIYYFEACDEVWKSIEAIVIKHDL